MGFVVNLLISSIVIFLTAYLLPGVQLKNFWTAILVAIVLGLVNAFVRPLVLLLTLPINILTLGLFTLVVNAIMVLLVDALVPNFDIQGFGNAVLFALIIWLFNWAIVALIF